MVEVFKRALQSRGEPKAKAKAKASESEGGNDPNLEEQQAWSALYGRWSREVLSALCENRDDQVPFRMVAMVMRRARAPWDHFRRLLMHRAGEGEPKALARLVWDGCDQIANEFEKLCNLEAWSDLIVSTCSTSEAISKLVMLIAAVTYRNAAGFDRRVRKLLREFPYWLLVLAKEVPSKACHERMACCNDILHDELVDDTAIKVRDLFRDEIANACVDGTLDPAVYSVFALMAITWDADSQAIEGINSRIKQQTVRARRIGLPLLTANIVVPNMCSLGTRDAPSKWSLIKPIMDHILSLAEGSCHKDIYEPIMSGRSQLAICDAKVRGQEVHAIADEHPSRWSPPPATQGVALAQIAKLLDSELKRASACSLLWYRSFEPKHGINCISRCLVIGPRVTPASLNNLMPREAWGAPLTYYFVGHLMKFVVVGIDEDEDTCTLALELSQPLTFTSSVDFFKNAIAEECAYRKALSIWTLNFHGENAETMSISASKPTHSDYLDCMMSRVKDCKDAKAHATAHDATGVATNSDDDEEDIERMLVDIIENDCGLMGDACDDVDVGWGRAEDEEASKHEHAIMAKADSTEAALQVVLELEDPSSEIATSEGDIFKCVQEISAGLVVVTPPWKPSEAESMLRWTESRVASAKALAMCATRESEFGGHAFPRPAGGWNLSLVLLPSEGKASLLHWQVFGASGQVVTLHDNDAIKFSTTYFFPVRCDFDFEWVVHDIGIKMVKARKANCPQCPAFVLRLLSMFNCAFSTSDSVSALEGDAIDGDVPLETCLWCGESGDRRPVQCSLCMHFWHSTCVQMAATSSKMPEGAAHIAHVPELISKGMCQLCCN